MRDDWFERRFEQIHDTRLCDRWSLPVRGSLIFLSVACCEAVICFGVGSLGGWCLGIVFWGIGIILVLTTTLNGMLYGFAGVVSNLRRPKQLALAVIGIVLNAALFTTCVFIPFAIGVIK
jgi:hypothetical protein